jgi:hypothetical protein
MVLCQNISSHAKDAMDLQMSALCTMGGGSELGYEKGQITMTLYGREGMELSMLKKMPLWKGDPAVIWRDICQRSFVLVSPIVAIWPLLITVGPKTEQSTLWSFTMIKSRDSWKLLAAIKNALANSFMGYMTPLINKDGSIIE